MFPITSEALELFKSSNRHVVEIKLTPPYDPTDLTKNNSIYLTEADIVQGGLTVDRYCISGDSIEIGSAIASELTLIINNNDGKFDDVVFEGAEIYVRIGVKNWDAAKWENASLHYVPLGYFTVDEAPRKLATITLTALDRMARFDKEYNSEINFSTSPIKTIQDILIDACDICDVILADTDDILLNHNYEVLNRPESKNLTYRQIIQWIAEISGTCAFIDWDGHLRFQWYKPTDTKITPSDRYTSDLSEQDIEITGVQVIDEDDKKYVSGDSGYSINIEKNGLIQNKHQEISNIINDNLKGFKYRPFECSTKPLPYLYPLDMVKYVDKKNVEHQSIITHITYNLNGNTSIIAKGTSPTKKGYASRNPLTKQQAAIIDVINKDINTRLNDRVQSVIGFNDLICNALGIYTTVVPQPDGSQKYYMHDQLKLENSNTIYTFNESGFAWTSSGWNGGNPVWESGIDKKGNAIFRMISAYGISVSQPENDHSINITPEEFIIKYLDKEILTVNGEQTELTKLKTKDFFESGKMRIIPHANGANLIILD